MIIAINGQNINLMSDLISAPKDYSRSLISLRYKHFEMLTCTCFFLTNSKQLFFLCHLMSD